MATQLYSYKNITNSDIRIVVNGDIITILPGKSYESTTVLSITGLEFRGVINQVTYNTTAEQERLQTTYVNLETYLPLVSTVDNLSGNNSEVDSLHSLQIEEISGNINAINNTVIALQNISGNVNSNILSYINIISGNLNNTNNNVILLQNISGSINSNTLNKLETISGDLNSFGLTTNFDAKGDCVVSSGASITAGNTIVQTSSALFKTSDIGKTICIHNANTGASDLITTISSFISSTSVSIASPAISSVSNVEIIFGTDDTAALNAIFQNLQTNGNKITLPAGNYLVTNGGLTCNYPVLFSGMGDGTMAGYAQSTITSLSITQPLLTINGHGSLIEHIYFDCRRSETPTTSVGINFVSGRGSNVNNVTVQNFGTNIDYTTCTYGRIFNSRIFDPGSIGVRIRNVGGEDYGDFRITGSTLAGMRYARLAQCAVRWESGGGFYFCGGNKINGSQPVGNSPIWTEGVEVIAQSDVYTQQIYIADNSIEGVYGCPVKVFRASPTSNGQLFRISVVNNELYSETSYACYIDGGELGHIYDILVDQNLIGGYNGIRILNCDSVKIGDNNIIHINVDSAIQFINCTNYDSGKSFIHPSTNQLLYNEIPTVNDGSGVIRRTNQLQYSREFPTITNGGGPVAVYSYRPLYNYNTSILEIETSHNVGGIGTGAHKSAWAVFTTDVAASISQIGTPINVGTSTISAQPTIVGGVVQILTSINSGVQLYGQMHIKINGNVIQVQRGSL